MAQKHKVSDADPMLSTFDVVVTKEPDEASETTAEDVPLSTTHPSPLPITSAELKAKDAEKKLLENKQQRMAADQARKHRLAPSDMDNSVPVQTFKKRKTKASGAKPPASIPIGRELLNAEHQGYPKGEIEYRRGKGARALTWDVRYFSDPNSGQILFSSPGFSAGGPHHFLSCHRMMPFTVEEWHGTAIFTSVEHLRQTARAMGLLALPKKISTTFLRVQETSPRLSSHNMVAHMLFYKGSGRETANFGTAFDELQQKDPKWWKHWEAHTEYLTKKALTLGLRAKYEQHPEDKISLMMTGNFELYEATTEFGGIGFTAVTAQGKQDKWGESLVGRLTMELRDQFRVEEPEWPKDYAFDYFRHMETAFPNKTKQVFSVTVDYIKKSSEKGDKLKKDWLRLGGPALKKRLVLMRKQAAETKLRMETKREEARVRHVLETQQALEGMNME